MRFLLSIIACAILAYGLAAYVSIPANPEVRFWRSVDQLRDKEIAEVRKQHPGQPILFFTGGSSCAFSIDPEIIEETCGMPAFNLGLPVAAGPKFLLHQALEKTQKGDILTICLEPDLLTYPEDFKPSQFSFAMATSVGQPSAAAGGLSFGESLDLREYLNLSRPGPTHIANLIGKSFTGKGYRYQASDIRAHGRIETSVSDKNLSRTGMKSATEILPAARQMLADFKQAASAKGVRLFYSMPWMLTDEKAAENNRKNNFAILKSINNMVPTVDDGHQGVAVDSAYFSDSGLHLTSQGSAIRSKDLAVALRDRLTSK